MKFYYSFEEQETYYAKHHELASLMGCVLEEEKGKLWTIFQWVHPGKGWRYSSSMGFGPTVWQTRSKKVALELADKMSENAYNAMPSI